MSVDVAGAPVSFGVFELTDPAAMAALPGPDRICAFLHETGYTGVDLGPVGFLGRGDELVERLRRFDLDLAGGWIDLPFSDDAAFAAALPSLEDAIAVFRAGATASRRRPARPTLADSGDAARRAAPGGGAPSLEGAAMRRFAANVEEAAGRIRAAGFEPTFHHHMGTYVETPAEIDAFLDATDVDLTFDTGHLLLGGGDPLEGWRRWHDRVNQVHLKDADLAVIRAVRQRRGDMLEVWRSRAFVPFGEGDLDVAGIVATILADGYDGWIVVEQDVLPSATTSAEAMERDQVLNLQRLAALLDPA